MIKGKSSYVIPFFDNVPYIKMNVGDHFGIVDIVGSSATKNFELEKFIEYKNLLLRQFTVMASAKSVETLTLNL